MRLLKCDFNMSVKMLVGEVEIEKPFSVYKEPDSECIVRFNDLLPEQYIFLSSISEDVRNLFGFPVDKIVVEMYNNDGEKEEMTAEEYLLASFPDNVVMGTDGNIMIGNKRVEVVNSEEEKPRATGRRSRKKRKE